MRAAQSTASKQELESRQLSIVYRSIDSLNPNPKNPRIHSPRQVRQIARSIEAFGFNVPFLVDAKLRVIAGHGRLEACKLLNIREVPTIRLEHLTEAQIQAFTIADNRLTENAAWNETLLAEQFKALSEVKLDFHLEDTGFQMSEIDLLIEGLAPVAKEKDDPADALPTQAGPEVTKPGDLWLLQRHRVLCGDALSAQAYQGLMEDQRAAAVFTDPPFNVRIDGYVNGFGRIHHREFAMASGEMTKEEFSEFLFTVCSHLVRYSVDGSLHFLCMDWRHIAELLAASSRTYQELKNVCIWVKDTGGQGSLYRSQHELVFVFKAGKGKHCNNIQLGQFGRYRTNVWTYPRVSSFARATEEGFLAAIHPTVKPVALVADAILDCTTRGETVLDPFLGSGTTVIAAERTGRTCFGMELEPMYVDAIIRRWQAFTGQEAVHAGTGCTFNQPAGGGQ